MVAVINLKDLMKYLVGLICTIFIVFWATRFLNTNKVDTMKSSLESTVQSSVEQLSKYSFLSCLNDNVPVIENINNNETLEGKIENSITDGNNYLTVLNMQISALDNLSEEINSPEDEAETNDDIEDTIEQADTDVETKQIEENNIEATYTNTYNNTRIKNQSSYDLTKKILTPDFKLTNTTDIIIFHTHTCESYTRDR